LAFRVSLEAVWAIKKMDQGSRASAGHGELARQRAAE
jgi:hypothetical protein